MFGNIPTEELLHILDRLQEENLWFLDEKYESHQIELELESRIPQEDYELEASDLSV